MRRLLSISVLVLSAGAAMPPAWATTISFTGDLRADATVTSCGAGCTLGPGNTDGEYAQYAAVLRAFSVSQTSTVQAITFSYGGGVNAQGTPIAEGGLEPYLSLFDGAGNFVASTFSGVSCPAGAQTNSMSGACYDVLLDGGVLAAAPIRSRSPRLKISPSRRTWEAVCWPTALPTWAISPRARTCTTPLT